VISLVVLAVAILALYGYKLAGRVGAGSMSPPQCSALYLNVFVGRSADLSEKWAFFHALAPHPKRRPPFAIVQGIVVDRVYCAWAGGQRRSFAPTAGGACVRLTGRDSRAAGVLTVFPSRIRKRTLWHGSSALRMAENIHLAAADRTY